MNIQVARKKESVLTEEAYTVYRQCMYNPDYEAYIRKINAFFNDKNTEIFTCLNEDKIVGMLVLTINGDNCAEIIGIAVHSSFQKQGVGSFMVRESANKMNLHMILAETDDDAVGFYKNMGFDITKEVKHYGNGSVDRYRCLLTLTKCEDQTQIVSNASSSEISPLKTLTRFSPPYPTTKNTPHSHPSLWNGNLN